MKVNLLSSPRNRSTLLMYSFAQRADTTVLDEPMYAYYLQHTGIQHPGREEVLQSQHTELDDVESGWDSIDCPVLFIKNMAHHYQTEDFHRLHGLKNILYIRNPRAIIRSYARVIETPTESDIGIKQVRLMHDYLCERNQPPVILDSDRLITNPRSTLTTLCRELGLSFNEEMLNWKPGPKPYDGVWAKHWYASVHESTGFIINQNAGKEQIELATHLEKLAQKCIPDYKYLKQFAIEQ